MNGWNCHHSYVQRNIKCESNERYPAIFPGSKDLPIWRIRSCVQCFIFHMFYFEHKRIAPLLELTLLFSFCLHLVSERYNSRAEWLEEQVVVWMNKTDVTCQNSTMHCSMQGKRNNRKRHSMKWIKLGSMPKHTCLVPNTGALGENGWLDGMVERLEGILIAPCYWLFCALCMFWFWISVCSVIESGWKVSWPKGSQSKLMEY